jgi:hypothetical protein
VRPKLKKHIIEINKLQSSATRSPERRIGEYQQVVIPSLREARRVVGIQETNDTVQGLKLPVEIEGLTKEQKAYVDGVNIALASVLAAATPYSLLLTAVLGGLGFRVTAMGIGIELSGDFGAAWGAGAGGQGMLFWD